MTMIAKTHCCLNLVFVSTFDFKVRVLLLYSTHHCQGVKGLVHPKIKIVINYSPSCCSKHSFHSFLSTCDQITVLMLICKQNGSREGYGLLMIVLCNCLQIVQKVLQTKPGGDAIIREYNKTKSLTDSTRRKMIKILTADMTEKHR